MLEALSTEKIALKIATDRKPKIGRSKGVLLNFNSLLTKTILASQEKNAMETRKSSKYCLLNSNASKLKGKKKIGSKNTNKYIEVLIILSNIEINY